MVIFTNIKKILRIAGLLATSYGIGKVHGRILQIRSFADVAEQRFPGYKDSVAKMWHDRIMKVLFEKE